VNFLLLCGKPEMGAAIQELLEATYETCSVVCVHKKMSRMNNRGVFSGCDVVIIHHHNFAQVLRDAELALNSNPKIIIFGLTRGLKERIIVVELTSDIGWEAQVLQRIQAHLQSKALQHSREIT